MLTMPPASTLANCRLRCLRRDMEGTVVRGERRLGLTGLEAGKVTTSNNNELRNRGNSRGAESGAVFDNSSEIGSGLARIIHAWPSLPEATRQAILRMIEKQEKEHQNAP